MPEDEEEGNAALSASANVAGGSNTCTGDPTARVVAAVAAGVEPAAAWFASRPSLQAGNVERGAWLPRTNQQAG